MEQQGIDLLFPTPSANMQYLTGIQRDRPNFGNVSYPGGWVLGALIGREKGPIVLAPRMVADYDLPSGVQFEVRSLPDQGDPFAFMAQALAEFGPVRRVAIENCAWSEAVLHLQRLLPDAGWSLASEILAPLRMIKDDDEIAIMRHAAHIADQVMAAVLPRLKVGMSELEVALEVDAQMVRHGAEGPSFTTNVFTMGSQEAREMREKESETPARRGRFALLRLRLRLRGLLLRFRPHCLCGRSAG